ncbi:acyl-CoA synthetase [Micromonospora sp. WMMD882]|uniref:acyl-CoA synthetase n=1 Tax=Micromonospora sp. WMMD882 TaxID=3015151 RepID=UPI00248C8E9D|nr:acyl-CoA synthetase [Micromonospora sp. WMMD882]WBB80736.1 acyl-CoA synthetase [Micromonospora sp. WMMD882]
MSLLSGLTRSPQPHPASVRIGGQTTSGESLLRCATAVADRVAGMERVAVTATASLETVVAVVGGLLAGVAVVPVPPDSGPRERAHILRDSAVPAVLAPTGTAADPGGPPVVPVDLTARSDTAYPEPDDDRPALVLYTSGTTGAPKGAVIGRGAVAACLDALAAAWAWTPDDLLVHGLPLFHVHGLVLGVLGPLRLGGRLHHVGRPDPARYAGAGGSLYFGVPTVWQRVCADPAAARALRGARLLVSGSAGLPTAVFDQLRALTAHRVVERYGMTETLITVSTRADGPRRPGTVGQPLRDVRTRLVDETGADVPHDGTSLGELLVRGPGLFHGYLNRPDADAASRTADGWFRTGDVAAVDPDGWHRIVGRAATDLIKSGGYRIGAGEVEDALLAHPAVAEAAVVGTPHPDLGQQVTAYVVADGVSGPELVDFVARELAVHKRPRQVHLVDRLPRTALGKVQKSQLGH